MDTLPNDLLNEIFIYSKNLNCVFVCKNWYNIALSNGKKCLPCNKFIKLCDIELYQDDKFYLKCHGHPTQINKYEIMRFNVNNTKKFIRLFNSLKKINSELNIEFKIGDENNIKIRDNNLSKSMLVNIKFADSNLQKFTYSKDTITTGITVCIFHDMIKNLTDPFSIIVYGNNMNPNRAITQLHIKTKNSRAKLKLLDLPNNFIQIPNISFDLCIDLKSTECKKICDKLKLDPNEFYLQISSNKIHFITKNDWSKWTYSLSFNLNIDIDNFKIKFNPQQSLLLLSTCASLSDKIKLCIKKDFPLVSRVEVEDLGRVDFLLAPSA